MSCGAKATSALAFRMWCNTMGVLAGGRPQPPLVGQSGYFSGKR